MPFRASLPATSALLILLAGAGPPSISHAQDARDQVIGTWKIDLAKSKFNPGPPPRSVTRTYEQAGNGVKVTVQGLDSLDTRTRYEYTVAYDGKDQPIKGTGIPGLADTIALTRIDPLTVNESLKKGGKQIYTATRTLSKDGKTLTFVTSGINASGKPTDNMTVYTRQ